MVRTSVAAASAAHRTRANRATESSRHSAAHSNTPGSANYGTISNAASAAAPASYGAMHEPDHAPPSASSTPTTVRPDLSVLPSSNSYHGQLHRADSPSPASEAPSDDTASTTSSSSAEEARLQPLPSYSDFKLAHYLLDMPITLLILGLFALLAVFGWPVPDSPYPHHVHWKQLGLGAITWISTEAIRRRIFRFLGSSRYPILRSTPFLLLLHTFIQELLRLFAIRLTFHNDHLEYSYPPSPPSLLQAANVVVGSGILGPPPRPPKGFFKAFHLALGFAAAENIWQTLSMLGQVRLYEGEPQNKYKWCRSKLTIHPADVLSPQVSKAWLVGEENLNSDNQTMASPATMPAPLPADHPSCILDDEDFVTDAPAVSDEEFEGYIRERKRFESEDSFGGVPLYNISVFVIGMWRLDA